VQKLHEHARLLAHFLSLLSQLNLCEESLQGGATSDFSLSNGGNTFWGVRTSGGILTVRWNPSSIFQELKKELRDVSKNIV
jgi:hypothetical protein